MSLACHWTARRAERRRERGEGDPAARRLAAHLAACAACRAAVRDSEPIPLFAGLTRGPLRPELAAEILRGVRRGLPEAAAPARPRFRPVPALLPGLGAALVLVWALVGGGAERRSNPAPWPADWSLPEHAMTAAVGTVEDIASETARIYTFSVAGETVPGEFILIVDDSLDL